MADLSSILGSSARHQILEALDSVKLSLTDQDYMTMTNALMKQRDVVHVRVFTFKKTRVYNTSDLKLTQVSDHTMNWHLGEDYTQGDDDATAYMLLGGIATEELIREGRIVAGRFLHIIILDA